jgi:SIR2-like domain
MLMVIFGAGASYDSAPAYPIGGPGEAGPWRPPLANNLFLDRHEFFGTIVERYPKLTHILPYLRSPSEGRSVEQILESLQEQGKDSPETQRELASVRFYLCDFLDEVTEKWAKKTNGVTNYATLIREVLRFNKTGAEICLVTFNYDLLLDHALFTFGYKPKPPEEHLLSHPILKLFKLHGSVNWSRTVDTKGDKLTPLALIERADDLRVTDKFVLVNAAREGHVTRYGSIFPAVAIPVQTKTEQHFECPAAHRKCLAEMLPRVTKVLIIGWQGREAHFIQMLRQELPKLRHVMVVGRDRRDSEEVLVRFLVDVGRIELNTDGHRFLGTGGFTHFIVNQEGDEFLAA